MITQYIEPLTLTERGNGSQDPCIEQVLFDHFADRDCFEDMPERDDDTLHGLTVIERPHITACGSIVAERNII